VKDYVLELTASKEGERAKLNILREYLQAYILRIMHDNKVFQNCAFLGGTALRFLYHLPRFSEDLDFSLVRGSSPFLTLIKNVKRELSLAGYNVSVSYNDQKTVQTAFVRFEGLMFEAGISSHKDQKFSVKTEIDTNPPAGGVLKTEIVNKYFPISFLSYDLSSLFAGKIGAVFNRKYAKGRDYFDLGWYLSRWKDIAPNITLLNNALDQAGYNGPRPTGTNWRDCLYAIVEKTDWAKVYNDVESFLENVTDLDIFTKKNVLKLIKPDYIPQA
jgi:predicted nucleotidyltransferase component of viral defense system